MARAPVYTATTSAQVRALASPIRLEILTFATAVGPCSLPELARACGRPADSLYRHARLLLKHNMLVAIKPRPVDQNSRPGSGRRAELVVDAAAERFTVDYEPSTGRGAPAFRRVCAAAFKAARQTLEDNEGNPRVAITGPSRNFGVRTMTAWLTPEQLKVVMEAIETATGQFDRGVGRASERPEDAELHHFTYVIAPVARRRTVERGVS